MTSEAKTPRFNHVAMTVPADLLDEDGRKAILDFYGEVFGWQELPTETIDRKRLVMMAYEFGQFVFIEADDNPMTTNTIDHYGMSVSTQAELDDFYDKAKAYSEKDDRTVLEAKMLDDFGGMLELHAFYVRHILPLKVEVQYFDWKQGHPVPANASAVGGAPAQERELRAQGRKTMQRLLTAGRAVFAQQGFHSARVDDIVKAAKTSHGTFYLYFSNKEDLFKALALDTMSEMEALGASLGPVTPDDDGRDTIRDWVTKFVDLYAAHGSVIRAWTEWELNDRELGRRAQSSLVQLSTALATRIHDVRVLDDGVISDRGVAEGLACLSMLERFNYFRESHQVDVSREEAIEILTRAVFEGFFVPDRAVVRRARRVRKAG